MKGRILVIDDEPGMLASLRYMLNNNGYDQVETCASAPEAIDRLKEKEFDLVITDLAMPLVSGHAVLEYVQEHCPQTPVVVITAYGSLESATKALRQGAFDFITKPFEMDVLLNTVRRALEKVHLQKEAQRRTQQMLALGEITRIINASLNLEEVFPPFVQQLRQIMAFDRVEVALLESGDTLRLAAVAGLGESILGPGLCLSLADKGPWQVVRNGRPLLRSGLSEDSLLPEETALLREGLRTLLTVPLIVGGETIGVFQLGNCQPDAYSQEDIGLAQQVADQIANAVQKASLFQQTQRQLAELRRTQAQLIRSARLAAAGELADGIVHEINNPLSVVLGSAQLLLRLPDLSPEVQADLEKIVASAQRIADLVYTFVSLAKPATSAPYGPTDVNQAINQALDMLTGRLIRSRVTVQKNLDNNLPLVHGNDDQLRRVFVNLILNAIEAMERIAPPPTGHQLRVTTRLTRDGNEETVEVLIADTGDGIPPENLDRIFEPGFTTKIENGAIRGLGMGLFVAYGIIEAHRGTIEVESEVGKGSTFTVRLPRRQTK